MSADDVARQARADAELPPPVLDIIETLPGLLGYYRWREIETLDQLAGAWVEWVAEYHRLNPVVG